MDDSELPSRIKMVSRFPEDPGFPGIFYAVSNLHCRSHSPGHPGKWPNCLLSFGFCCIIQAASVDIGSGFGMQGGRTMALYTKKLIMTTFQAMLEELPFDKITVAALVKRAGISPNTAATNPSTKTCCAPAPCWITPAA